MLHVDSAPLTPPTWRQRRFPWSLLGEAAALICKLRKKGRLYPSISGDSKLTPLFRVRYPPAPTASNVQSHRD